MKLEEMEFNGREGDFVDLGSILGQYRGSKVRVEVHSIEPEPWPTERPEGWGYGWWFLAGDLPLIAIGGKEDLDCVIGLNPITGTKYRVCGDEFVAFGPRAEVPG